jgi:outer membrane biogenesis lipoprotein LolB
METILIVIQSFEHDSDVQLQRITLSESKEETRYQMKGKIAFLQVGTCDNGKQCSRMTWQDKDLYCTVLLMSSPFELIKIAESMIQ